MKFLFYASAFGTRVPENDLKDLKDLKASDDFGIVHVECGEYFRPGAEWILQGFLEYSKNKIKIYFS